MLKFLLGAAVGYVLGAKAGHERYEQLVRTYQRISDHPAVQGAAGVVRARVDEKLHGAPARRGVDERAPRLTLTGHSAVPATFSRRPAGRTAPTPSSAAPP